MKSIFVLLTRHRGIMGRFIQISTLSRYTHAAISTELEKGIFYSVVVKNGFYSERPLLSRKLEKLSRKCSLYRLEVSDEIYDDVSAQLREYQTGIRELHYSFFGVALCILQIPRQPRSGYFCSQFVAELLSLSGAITAHKKTSIFLPDDFRRVPQLKLCFEGTVGELAQAIT